MNGSEMFMTKIQVDHLHRSLQRIAARVRVPDLSTFLTVALLEQPHRGDGVPSSNVQTDRNKGKSPAWCKAGEILRAKILRRWKFREGAGVHPQVHSRQSVAKRPT